MPVLASAAFHLSISQFPRGMGKAKLNAVQTAQLAQLKSLAAVQWHAITVEDATR